MRPFEILDTQDLLTALAEYTERYTKILTEGGKDKDLLNYRETIQSLIKELELRKNPDTSVDPASNKDR